MKVTRKLRIFALAVFMLFSLNGCIAFLEALEESATEQQQQDPNQPDKDRSKQNESDPEKDRSKDRG